MTSVTTRRHVVGALLLGGGVAIATRVVPVLARIVRSWEPRVSVHGMSMSPGLLPGDWLLVDPRAYARRMPRPGDLVVATDPRSPARLLVKRVVAVAGAELTVDGDAVAHRAHADGPWRVDAGTVLGAPWFRYWPPRRWGAIGRRPGSIAAG